MTRPFSQRTEVIYGVVSDSSLKCNYIAKIATSHDLRDGQQAIDRLLTAPSDNSDY